MVYILIVFTLHHYVTSMRLNIISHSLTESLTHSLTLCLSGYSFLRYASPRVKVGELKIYKYVSSIYVCVCLCLCVVCVFLKTILIIYDPLMLSWCLLTWWCYYMRRVPSFDHQVATLYAMRV